MKKSIISIFVGLLCFGSIATSCEDMLTPDLERYATEFTGKDTVNFYAGILRGVQQITEQNILLGELRGDLVTPTDYVTDSISEIANFQNLEDGENALLNAAAYYKVINQCNYYLDKVDSLSCNNNYYYMRKETAQVLLIRAWTYMQLVQNYGKVPFITDPITNSNTGWETNPKAWASAEDLVTLLHDDMEQAWAYCQAEGYPNYSNVSAFNTGLVAVNQQLLNFDADVIYGDLYLLRGKDTADFEAAAEHYYNFLYKEARTKMNVKNIARQSKNDRVTPPTFEVNGKDWTGNAANEAYAFGNNEVVTGVPSAANSHFGLVLSRIPNIYGFTIHSGNSTESGADDEGNETVTTTGSISTTSNYKVRQVQPSYSYEALNKAQSICVPSYEQGSQDLAPTEVDYAKDCYDSRMDYSAPLIETQDVGRIRFISKFCGNSSNVNGDGLANNRFEFRYLLPLYRYRTIMLRYAEALNRAGFPGHAFAIIRDGLDPATFPMLEVANDTIVEADSTVYAHYVLSPQSEEGPNYISSDELARAYDKPWIKGIIQYGAQSQVGLREAGCGASISENYDTLYTYRNQIAQRLSEEDSRLGTAAARKYIKRLADEEGDGGEGTEPEDTTDEEPPIDTTDFKFIITEPAAADPAEIRAMSLLIADQYALETAFEGQRYYDLMRIARHLDTFEGANYGTQWLAWKIARRGLQLAPYEEPTQKDARLFNLLSDKANWYLPLPKK